MGRRPGRNPRINIGVTPGTKEVLERMADVMGTSVSAVVGEIIEEAFPQLLAVTEALEKTKSDPSNSMADLQLAMIQAQRRSLDVQSDFLKSSNNSDS